MIDALRPAVADVLGSGRRACEEKRDSRIVMLTAPLLVSRSARPRKTEDPKSTESQRPRQPVLSHQAYQHKFSRTPKPVSLAFSRWSAADFFLDLNRSPLPIMSQRRFTPFYRNTVYITTLGRKPDAMHSRMPLLPTFAYIRVLP